MSEAMQSKILSPTSFAAFQVALKFNDVELASGTAFFAGVGDRVLLVTNKHNVLGRNIKTGACLDKKNSAIPNMMSVLIPVTSKKDQGFICSSWQRYHIPLYHEQDETRPTWIDHPDPAVDLVGFKFAPPEVNLRNLVLPADGPDLPLQICIRVNVVGYPFGLSTDNFPIWSTGYTASEPAIDVDGKPLMYIDCRTRQGQSGSPVVRIFHPGEAVSVDGKTYMAKQEQVFLLGIYSGRVNPESDIGMVWKKRAIVELFEEAEKDEK
jgi:hypothetical protein